MRNLLFCILFLFAGLLSRSQQVITGKVKSVDNDSTLAGASVSVKGTSGGTVTDQTGNFSLKVSSLPVTVVISYAGFANQEITFHGKESPIIRLERSYTWNEVVVHGPSRS